MLALMSQVGWRRPRSRLKLETRLKFRSVFPKNTGSVKHVRAPLHIHRHIHIHIRRMQTFSYWPNSEQRRGLHMLHVNHMSLSAHVSTAGGPCFSPRQLCARASSYKYRQQLELAQLTGDLALVRHLSDCRSSAIPHLPLLSQGP